MRSRRACQRLRVRYGCGNARGPAARPVVDGVLQVRQSCHRSHQFLQAQQQAGQLQMLQVAVHLRLQGTDARAQAAYSLALVWAIQPIVMSIDQRRQPFGQGLAVAAQRTQAIGNRDSTGNSSSMRSRRRSIDTRRPGMGADHRGAGIDQCFELHQVGASRCAARARVHVQDLPHHCRRPPSSCRCARAASGVPRPGTAAKRPAPPRPCRG